MDLGLGLRPFFFSLAFSVIIFFSDISQNALTSTGPSEPATLYGPRIRSPSVFCCFVLAFSVFLIFPKTP